MLRPTSPTTGQGSDGKPGGDGGEGVPLRCGLGTHLEGGEDDTDQGESKEERRVEPGKGLGVLPRDLVELPPSRGRLDPEVEARQPELAEAVAGGHQVVRHRHGLGRTRRVRGEAGDEGHEGGEGERLQARGGRGGRRDRRGEQMEALRKPKVALVPHQVVVRSHEPERRPEETLPVFLGRGSRRQEERGLGRRCRRRRRRQVRLPEGVAE